MSCICSSVLDSTTVGYNCNATSTEFRLDLTDKEKTLLAIISGFQFLTGCSLNALVILVLAVNYRTLLQVPSNFILLSLVMSDLLSCSFLPYHLYLLWARCHSHIQHHAYRILVAFCSSCSICNIVVLTFDRFLAIVHPLRYNALVTTSRARCLLVFAWCCAIVYTVLLSINLFFNINPLKLILESVAVAALVFTIALYWKIFRSARYQIRKIQTVYRSQRLELKMSLKSAATTVRIVLLFVVSYVPLLVFVFFVESNAAKTVEEKGHFLIWALSFSFWNACVNPLVYFICSPRFRENILKSVRRYGFAKRG